MRLPTSMRGTMNIKDGVIKGEMPGRGTEDDS